MGFNPFIGGGGGTSSEDKVARAEIAAIKDGEILDSFSDVETALADKADITDIPTVPIIAIQKNGTDIVPVSGTVNIIVPTTAADVSALPDTTKYASTLSLTINSQTFVITGQLKDQNGNNLGEIQTIDLPLESVVVDGSYNSQTKKVVLTLQNGNTVEFSVADLVEGLQSELTATNKLNPAYINYDNTHAAVTEAQRTQIGTNQAAIKGQQNTTTSGGNGYAIINGQRLYMSDTAPSGDIPVGSALVSNGKVWGYKASTVVNPTILSDGTPISNYNIKGNTEQNGIPTESNPVEIVGVGILGKNLYNFRAGAYQTGVRYISDGEVEINENYSIWSIGVSALSSGTYTFSLDSASTSTTTLRVVGFKNGVKVGMIGATQLVNMPLSITVTDAYDEIRFSAVTGYAGRIMLNSGSTALPYEPYGYYLPVSSGGTTTNIPIGTVQTTRVIKKLVLDGTESWGKSGSGDTAYFSLNVGDSNGSNCYCSHFVYTSITSENTDIGIRLSGSSQNIRIRPTDVANTDETAFKTWLATQYANGTPVTVLYLRAEATNTVSNEPLYRISTSYDNLYYTQSQVSIPTIAGENSITFLTDVQPSRFTITVWVEDVLTPEQEAALNSGITSTDVAQIEINKNNISSQQDTTAQGGNGYALINGIRLYVSSTAPTGDIPDGSIGVGW